MYPAIITAGRDLKTDSGQFSATALMDARSIASTVRNGGLPQQQPRRWILYIENLIIISRIPPYIGRRI